MEFFYLAKDNGRALFKRQASMHGPFLYVIEEARRYQRSRLLVEGIGHGLFQTGEFYPGHLKPRQNFVEAIRRQGCCVNEP